MRKRESGQWRTDKAQRFEDSVSLYTQCLDHINLNNVLQTHSSSLHGLPISKHTFPSPLLLDVTASLHHNEELWGKADKNYSLLKCHFSPSDRLENIPRALACKLMQKIEKKWSSREKKLTNFISLSPQESLSFQARILAPVARRAISVTVRKREEEWLETTKKKGWPKKS